MRAMKMVSCSQTRLVLDRKGTKTHHTESSLAEIVCNCYKPALAALVVVLAVSSNASIAGQHEDIQLKAPLDKHKIERILVEDSRYFNPEPAPQKIETLMMRYHRPYDPKLLKMRDATSSQTIAYMPDDDVSKLLREKLVNPKIFDNDSERRISASQILKEHSSAVIADILSQTKAWNIARFSVGSNGHTLIQNLLDKSTSEINFAYDRLQISSILNSNSNKWFLLDLNALEKVLGRPKDSYSRTDAIVTALLQDTPANNPVETEPKDQDLIPKTPAKIASIRGSLSALKPSPQPLEPKETKEIKETPVIEQNTITAANQISILEGLEAAIFERPTDIQLNLQLFQEYLKVGDFESAEITLDRILIFDPSSRYAKILLAETRIKQGKLSSARSVLLDLIETDDLPDAMRTQADTLVSQIEQQLDRTNLRSSMMIAYGRTNNIFSAPDDDKLSFYGFPIDSTTPNEHKFFKDSSIETTWSYELPSLKPQLVTLGGGINQRDYNDDRVTDTNTVGLSAGYKQLADWGVFDALAFYSRTRGNSEALSSTGLVTFNISTPVSDTIQFGSSLAYSTTGYNDEANASQNSETVSAAASLSGALANTLWSLSASSSDSNAKSPAYSTDAKSLSLKLARQIGVCTTGLTETQSWSKAKAPLAFVHPTIKKSQTTTKSAIDITCLIPSGQGFNLKPFITASKTESRSGLSNYDKTSSEISAGVKIDF